MGRVLEYVTDRLRHGPMHMTLIDPEKTSPERAAALARGARELGTGAIMLGGSTGVSRDRMTLAAQAVRTAVEIPIIIFPAGPDSLSPAADAVYFMSLLNSRNVDLVIRAQARAATHVRELGIEPISLGYLVVAPGMRVGEVGQVDSVPRDDPDLARGFALAAEYFGMRLVYLEAGSGAPAPVPEAMVRAVRAVLTVPLIVGGGIRTGSDARRLLEAGAQILVTGTVAEEEGLGPGFRGILAEVRARREE